MVKATIDKKTKNKKTQSMIKRDINEGMSKYLNTQDNLKDKKRIERIPFFRTSEMPDGAIISGKVVCIVKANDIIKQDMLNLKTEGGNVLFPITKVIETELKLAFGSVDGCVENMVHIKKIGEKDSLKYRGKKYTVYQIFVD